MSSALRLVTLDPGAQGRGAGVLAGLLVWRAGVVFEFEYSEPGEPKKAEDN